MKKFEEIKTAEELLQYTRIHGIPTDQDSINFMQDVVGHDTLRNLTALAETQDAKKADALFHLLFTIWNWRDAVAFYNQHGNPAYQDLKNRAAELDLLQKSYTEAVTRRTESDNKLRELETEIRKRDEQIRLQQDHMEEMDLEILKLKAKLYDMVAKEAQA